MEEKLGDAKIVGNSIMDIVDIEAILRTKLDLIMSERQSKIYAQFKEIFNVDVEILIELKSNKLVCVTYNIV